MESVQDTSRHSADLWPSIDVGCGARHLWNRGTDFEGHVCGLDAATAAFPYAVWGYAHKRAAPVELCAESCPPAGPFTSRRALALAVTF